MSDDAFQFDLEVRDPARVLVSPLKVPGLENPAGLLVLRDWTLVISTTCPLRSALAKREYKIMKISPWGQEIPLDLGPDIWLNSPTSVAEDAGDIVFADTFSHSIRRIKTERGHNTISTVAGGVDMSRESFSREMGKSPHSYNPYHIQGLVDARGAEARFRKPEGVLAAHGMLIVADTGNHAIRVIERDGMVRTLAGNGQRGSVDGEGLAAQFRNPSRLALDIDGSILVSDESALRRVTMEGLVTTVAGNGEQNGFADGAGTNARFSNLCDVVVDGDGVIVVADMENHCLRKIVRDGAGYLVTTLVGVPGRERNEFQVDGNGAAFMLSNPTTLALDGHGRVLVSENPPSDETMWVVDASLAPRFPDRSLAFAMSQHKRLGQGARAYALKADLVKMILDNMR
jgi:sugar lactone lactonase YvrE